MVSIRTQAIDGVHPHETLLIVDDGARSFVIVKGRYDNIAVELDEDGWHELAAMALQTSLYREVPPEDREDGVVTAIVRQGLRNQGMTIGDAAKRVGVDVAAVRSVWNGEASLPEDELGRWARVLGVEPLKLAYAWQVDRSVRPEVPVMVVAYGGRRETRGRNRPRRRERVGR